MLDNEMVKLEVDPADLVPPPLEDYLISDSESHDDGNDVRDDDNIVL